jgi:hypothetical protein
VLPTTNSRNSWWYFFGADVRPLVPAQFTDTSSVPGYPRRGPAITPAGGRSRSRRFPGVDVVFGEIPGLEISKTAASTIERTNSPARGGAGGEDKCQLRYRQMSLRRSPRHVKSGQPGEIPVNYLVGRIVPGKVETDRQAV